MRYLATILMMMSLVAMSVTVAGAEISRPSCSGQLRAGDLCYAADLPVSKTSTDKKTGGCHVCLLLTDDTSGAAAAGTWLPAAFGTVMPKRAHWTIPWRPPRA